MVKLTDEQYQLILNSKPTLWQKTVAFFKHVWYMALAPNTVARYRYRATFKQFQDRQAKGLQRDEDAVA